MLYNRGAKRSFVRSFNIFFQFHNAILFLTPRAYTALQLCGSFEIRCAELSPISGPG